MPGYLLVDAGNSRIKWNVYNTADNQITRPPQRANWRDGDIAVVLQNQWRELSDIHGVLTANVAGQGMQQAIQHYAHSQWGVQAKFITTQTQAFGVRNAYKIPEQLGVDRWLAVLAARQLFPDQNVCVVDCGTAVTVDTVTPDGQHKGGLIIPGPHMMKTALFQQTHGVKIGHGDAGVSPFTDSTTAGVNHGVLLATVAFVDRAVTDIEKALGAEVIKIITGGDAQLVATHSLHSFNHQPEMVLKGLALFASEDK
jgi:type III pantothenate kinase